MKKIIITCTLVSFFLAKSQFKVNVSLPNNISVTEAYLYSYDGSKDILAAKGNIKGSTVDFKVSKNYSGMMRLVIYPASNAINFITENKNVDMQVGKFESNVLKEISYKDPINIALNDAQSVQTKKESIYPALLQIKDYYKSTDEFYQALDKEIKKLSAIEGSQLQNHPVAQYYLTTMEKYVNNPNIKSIPKEDFIKFFQKSDNSLESSSLMKPILISYLNVSNKENLNDDISTLLKAVDVETPRGQTILSELIEIFDTYDMKELKDKYLAEAKGLKCTINDRLAGTIKTNDNVALGAIFPNNIFENSINTKAKSINDVKADQKIIMFWSSTCSHCIAEMPKLLEKYKELKAKNIEIIAMSVDADLNSFRETASQFPWISASEGKGWNSSYTTTYNVHATPTFFILDKNNKIINKPDHVQDVLSYFNVK